MEIFKDIENYEGLYQISNTGKVKSFVKWRGNSEPRLLSLPLNSDGYPMVGLVKNGKRKTVKVHSLVAMAFLNHIPKGNIGGLVIDHLDHDKTNNNVSNLKIVTHRENCARRKKKYTSKYVGVSWRKDRKKWTARINIDGNYKHLGNFDNEEDAHESYKKTLSLYNQSHKALSEMDLSKIVSKYISIPMTFYPPAPAIFPEMTVVNFENIDGKWKLKCIDTLA